MSYKNKTVSLLIGGAIGGVCLLAGAIIEARSPKLRVWDLRGNVAASIKQARKRELTRLGKSIIKYATSYIGREYHPVADLSDPNCLQILHISDLHLHAKRKWLIKYLPTLHHEKIDLVVLSGDNFSDASGLEALKVALEKFQNVPRVFVWGSNDYYSGVPKNPLRYFLPAQKTIKPKRKPDLPTREFQEWLEARGWTNLNNTLVSFELSPRQINIHANPTRENTKNNIGIMPEADTGNNTVSSAHSAIKIAISGVDDPHINRDQNPEFDSNWVEANLRIGLTHAPYMRVLNAFWAARADLILSGHTHGGQICLPFIGAIVNNSDIPLRYSGGLSPWSGEKHQVKPRIKAGVTYPLPNLEHLSHQLFSRPLQNSYRCWLHVSRGLGTSKYAPMRLFCRPEASILLTPFRKPF